MKLTIALVCSCLFYQAFSQTEVSPPKCQGSILELMATSIQSLQAQLDELKAKQAEYHELIDPVSMLNASQRTGPQVAFTAWVLSNTKGGNVLKYSSPQVNLGNALNPNTGKFTAPLNGLYWFNFMGLTTSTTNVPTDITTIYLRVNGVNKDKTMSSKYYFALAMGGFFILEAGDVVDIRVETGEVSGTLLWSTFSGYIMK